MMLISRILPTMFSPRARGCSLGDFIGRPRKRVFPACAGMFLLSIGPSGAYCGFPRVRGDVPRGGGVITRLIAFSPRARGCSSKPFTTVGARGVFPACAGMFPVTPPSAAPISCFPRVRGDVPHDGVTVDRDPGFSPRARGCSARSWGGQQGCGVFPACAGMFPHRTSITKNFCRFPRVRGDVPSMQCLSKS